MKHSLSISVMAHSSRERYFQYLKDRLGDVPFLIDQAGSEIGVWPNCRRAWLAYDPNCSHHIVIQDDAIVCDNFKERAETFIKEHIHEKRAFNFFYARKEGMLRSKIGDGMRDGYIRRTRNAWGVAICIPTKYIQEMINFCDRYEMVKEDDTRIAKYLFRHGFDVFYPIPSLIDHRDDDTLVGAINRGRHAYIFIDNDKK